MPVHKEIDEMALSYWAQMIVGGNPTDVRASLTVIRLSVGPPPTSHQIF